MVNGHIKKDAQKVIGDGVGKLIYPYCVVKNCGLENVFILRLLPS